jgi:HEAT repeat protein
MIKAKFPGKYRLKKANVSYASILMIIFFTLIAGNTVVAESPAKRTAGMIPTLEGLERHDAVFPEFTSLLEEVFSKKRPHRKSAAIINRFLLTETYNPGKRYLVSEIAGLGIPSAINYLATLLAFDQTARMALMAMENIPDPHTDKALQDIFPRVAGETRVGIINVIGRRNNPGAYDFLLRFISDPDPAVSRAAVASLGRAGVDRAAPVLNAAMRSASIPNPVELMDALMTAAEKFESDGKHDRAYEIYVSVLEIAPPGLASVAAIRGMIRTTAGRPEDILAEMVTASPPDLRIRLMGLVKELPVEYDQAYHLFKVPGLTDDDRIMLLTALAARNDSNIHDEAIRFLHHEDIRYREAAIFAMFDLATSGDILLLAGLASSADGREQGLLREVIYRIPGPEADELILRKAREISGPTGVELIMAIRERHIRNAARVLFETSGSDDQDIRMESYRSLGRIAGGEDIDRLAGLLTQTAASRERQELERAIYLTTVREETPGTGSSEIIALLGVPLGERDRASLISILGNIKNPNDLHVLLGYLDHDSEELRLSAIRALSDWPDAGPAPRFRELLETSDDLRIKTLTLRGFTRVILNDANMGNDQKANELLYGLSVAPNDNEKRLIISGLGNVHSSAALAILADQMEYPELRREVEAAILNLLPRLIERHPDKTRKELDRIIKYSGNQELLKWAKE